MSSVNRVHTYSSMNHVHAGYWLRSGALANRSPVQATSGWIERREGFLLSDVATAGGAPWLDAPDGLDTPPGCDLVRTTCARARQPSGSWTSSGTTTPNQQLDRAPRGGGPARVLTRQRTVRDRPAPPVPAVRRGGRAVRPRLRARRDPGRHDPSVGAGVALPASPGRRRPPADCGRQSWTWEAWELESPWNPGRWEGWPWDARRGGRTREHETPPQGTRRAIVLRARRPAPGSTAGRRSRPRSGHTSLPGRAHLCRLRRAATRYPQVPHDPGRQATKGRLSRQNASGRRI